MQIGNCGNEELCKLVIVEIGKREKREIKEIGNCGNRELIKLKNCGIRPKCYPVCDKFYLHGQCAERER